MAHEVLVEIAWPRYFTVCDADSQSSVEKLEIVLDGSQWMLAKPEGREIKVNSKYFQS
jgi:hypothetical protein